MNSVQKCQTHIRNLAVWTPQDFQCMLSHNIQNGKKIKEYKHMKSSKKATIFSWDYLWRYKKFLQKVRGLFRRCSLKKGILKNFSNFNTFSYITPMVDASGC